MPVTVVLPFHNSETTLACAIQSVFAQTYTDWRLMLINDGSTDYSLRVASSVRDSRVSVISHDVNRGLAMRLNEAATLVETDLIARFDADDLMHPNRLATQVDFLESNLEVDVLGTGLCSLDDYHRPLGMRGSDVCLYSTTGLLRKKQSLVHPSIVARRAWFLRNRYAEDIRRAQDFELWVRSSSQGDFRAQSLAMPLHFYREDGNLRLSSQLRSRVVEIATARRYGDLSDFIAVLSSATFKAVATTSLALLDQLGWLQELRNEHFPSEQDRHVVAQVMNRIHGTSVPNLDCSLSTCGYR